MIRNNLKGVANLIKRALYLCRIGCENEVQIVESGSAKSWNRNARFNGNKAKSFFGDLAQMVGSAGLLNRRSWVRVPESPLKIWTVGLEAAIC